MQNFKGDSLELKMQGVAGPVFDLTGSSLDDFYENCYDSNSFLLMLYDQKRMPFSDRIKRDVFIQFIKEAIKQFPVTGTFESYIFILRAIFGNLSEINFEIDGPGLLSIEINAVSTLEFEFIGRERLPTGGFEVFNISDSEDTILMFRGLSGIESQYDLELLFSEITTMGISPDIFLSFFTRYDFVAEQDSELFNMVDQLGNQIVFTEVGG